MKMKQRIILCFVFLMSVLHTEAEKPNIIFIVADDLGWNDVGFHGSNQIPTPNIDALAYSGIILNNYYVQHLCTPSRSALMTGKYPIHTGMQHFVLLGAEPRGLPLSEKLLPEYLKDLGYVNRMVGKWHLGYYKKEYTPTYRGFLSHLGYWGAFQDYNDHTMSERGQWGLDMRKNMDIAYDLHGKYSTDIFTHEAVRLIKTHNTSEPLFLYMSHLAVHSANDYNPLQAPDEYFDKFPNISQYKRRLFAGMLTKLDESVGAIVEALSETDMLSNSIIVFTTDNGGTAAGCGNNWASNYPLRGMKNTLWEGGIRGAALLWSHSLKNKQRVSNQMMHIADWLPTLYTAAGGDSKEISENLDGVDLWKTLTENRESPRKTILHNIDDVYGGYALRTDDMKIVKGSANNGTKDSWYGPSGRTDGYNVSEIINSQVGRKIVPKLDQKIIETLRNEVTIKCNETVDPIPCYPIKEVCLFNIKEDPCEQRNLANLPQFEETLSQLLETLAKFNSTAIPASNLPIDPRGFPENWDYIWTNFGDHIEL